ncbi:protein-tyrosine phosphatase [Gorgonomyces haynaldii]|nr:protein-tyrosine phosphatase [Gorgonomyces haynaldii]
MKEVVVPPLNFAMVNKNIYRSGLPGQRNFPFLKKLGLKSIMYLCDDDISPQYAEFLKEEKIQIFHIKTAGNKEPFLEMDKNEIAKCLLTVIDESHHPILLHCNKGKYRVGCLVGCLRKVQQWSMASIFDEYRRFSGTSFRVADQDFIESFDAIYTT